MVWYLYLSETPCSQRDTACRVTHSFSASSSWVHPFWMRSCRITSFVSMSSPRGHCTISGGERQATGGCGNAWWLDICSADGQKERGMPAKAPPFCTRFSAVSGISCKRTGVLSPPPATPCRSPPSPGHSGHTAPTGRRSARWRCWRTRRRGRQKESVSWSSPDRLPHLP